MSDQWCIHRRFNHGVLFDICYFHYHDCRSLSTLASRSEECKQSTTSSLQSRCQEPTAHVLQKHIDHNNTNSARPLFKLGLLHSCTLLDGVFGSIRLHLRGGKDISTRDNLEDLFNTSPQTGLVNDNATFQQVDAREQAEVDVQAPQPSFARHDMDAYVAMSNIDPEHRYPRSDDENIPYVPEEASPECDSRQTSDSGILEEHNQDLKSVDSNETEDDPLKFVQPSERDAFLGWLWNHASVTINSNQDGDRHLPSGLHDPVLDAVRSTCAMLNEMSWSDFLRVFRHRMSTPSSDDGNGIMPSSSALYPNEEVMEHLYQEYQRSTLGNELDECKQTVGKLDTPVNGSPVSSLTAPLSIDEPDDSVETVGHQDTRSAEACQTSSTELVQTDLDSGLNQSSCVSLNTSNDDNARPQAAKLRREPVRGTFFEQE